MFKTPSQVAKKPRTLNEEVQNDHDEENLFIGFKFNLNKNLNQAQNNQGVSIDMEVEEKKIDAFCERATSLEINYANRFAIPLGSDMSCASAELVKNIRETFELLNKNDLRVALGNKPELRISLQQALMSLSRKIAEMEAQNLLVKNPELNLEYCKGIILGKNYDSLENFAAHIQSQLRCTRKYLIKFRALFPLAGTDTNLPDELGQPKIKHFTDIIQDVFSVSFEQNVVYEEQITPVAPNRAPMPLSDVLNSNNYYLSNNNNNNNNNDDNNNSSSASKLS